MSGSDSRPAAYSDRQRREAAEWFVIIHAEEEPSTENLQAWLRWLDEAEGNRVAFESVVQAWHGIPRSTALSMPGDEELLADEYDGEQSVGEWLAAQAAAAPKPPASAAGPSGRSPFRRRRRAWLAAASIAALTLVGFTMNRYLTEQGSQSDSFSTGRGEQIQITLADGSRVWLGPSSQLQVEFTTARRGLELRTGEAFFSVRKDHERPFVVHSAGGDIVAVGTAFNVRAVSTSVIVSVSEGVVTVAPRAPFVTSGPDSVRVGSGQQATFAAHEPAASIAITQSAAPDERARWRDGVLVYRDEPLRDVVMDVARYTSRQLELDGDTIGSLRYSGVVYKGAVDEWTAALPESFPVRIIHEGNREIIVAR